MELVFKNDEFAVFDNFFSSIDFELAWNYFQSEEYKFIHSTRWVKVNHLLDGNPLLGPAYLSDQNPEDKVSKVYPVGNGMDLIFNKIRDHEQTIEPWVGKRDRDWKFFFGRPYLYPQGTGLAWHDDYTGVTGAYILYMHPQWNSRWGGELMIADPSTNNMARPQKQVPGSSQPKILGPYIDNSFDSERLLEVGIGHFIQPKPNRFIVLKAGVQHMIKKVEAAAGDHSRCSISGFFLNPAKADARQ